MASVSEKLEKMRLLAASVGAVQVAAAPVKRPPDINRMRHRAAEGMSQEIQRIVSIPIKYKMTQEDIEVLSRHYFQMHAFNSGWRLLPSQAESLIAYNDNDGAFLPLAVGGGKTLTSLLIANDAYQKGVDKVMLIVPPALAEQLCDTDIKHWRPLTIFNMPVHRIQGLAPDKRKLLANSGRKGLYVFTYSLLSTKDAHSIMQSIRPELIILDEAHSVSGQSARAGRFTRYIKEASPQVVALSGTMTQKRLTDYFELARATLGKGNFLPNSRTLADEWSKIIDSTATSLSDFKNDTIPRAGPIQEVVLWAKRNFPENKEYDRSIKGFREAFQSRLTYTPGVVCSSGDGLPYSLYINNEPVENHTKCKGWDKVVELTAQLDNEWKTPNGDEIEEAMHLFRWKYWIVGAGFYNELYWPEVDWMRKRGGYASDDHAKEVLERSQEYHGQHLAYQRSLRSWIKNSSRPNLDTPMLVGNSMARYGAEQVGSELYRDWSAWKDADFEGRIDRNKRVVRVCGFKVEKAVKWAKELEKGEGGIIWYDNDEMGVWVSERLLEDGVDFIHCPAGDVYNKILNDPVKCKGKVLVLTINAHFQGKNLQFDRNMFYLQWPRSAKYAEQSIGRQHRHGLIYDEVYVTTCHTTEFDRVLFGATLNDAAYVHQSQGNRQKIIYATHVPKPQIVPYEVLIEWGSEAIKLDSDSERVLRNTFVD